MGEYWRVIGHYDAETTTYSACAGSAQTSPYTPDENARLVGLRAIASSEAVTSLTELVQFRLTCTTFKPNTIHVVVAGGGLRTAPFPQPAPIDYSVNQPVLAGVPITIEARNNATVSPVTVSVILLGKFVS